ncbi:MAG: hypothetical protein ABSE16_13355 [Verrucomicrobiota bacterium]|jgi:putative hemolysin
MGFLTRLFQFRSKATVQLLPSGSMTVDHRGRVVTSTVSSAYPEALLNNIGREVVLLFREAHTAQMPLAEISLHFSSLHVTARELRGGAVIFLFPQTAFSPTATGSHL